MQIILIVAMAANRVIGRDNDIPWHIPSDQQMFKRLTMGHTLVMGRKTYESIGRPLPGRKTVIVSRQSDYVVEGCLVMQCLEEALEACREDEKVFIVGGGEIFALALPRADAMYLTTLAREVEGDVYFPEFLEAEFVREREELFSEEEPYVFTVWRRQNRV